MKMQLKILPRMNQRQQTTIGDVQDTAVKQSDGDIEKEMTF